MIRVLEKPKQGIEIKSDQWVYGILEKVEGLSEKVTAELSSEGCRGQLDGKAAGEGC